MLCVVPSQSHPIYVEWRKWRHRQNDQWSSVGAEAMKSIEAIAEHMYPDHPCIVGEMIMMDDLQTEAEETALKAE